MSYYQKRTVSVKCNNAETKDRWNNLLNLLKETNEDMAKAEEIMAEVDNNNGLLWFEFEYYTGEAFKEFEELLELASHSDTQEGVIVKLDSDYGSYISTYGEVASEEIEPSDEEWITGTFTSMIISINPDKLAEWIECEEEELEDAVYDLEEEFAELLGVSEYEDIDIEVEGFEEDDDKCTLQLGLGMDFLRFGTIDKLSDDLDAIRIMNTKIESIDGSLTFGQAEMMLDKDRGECIWISEDGFKELKLECGAREMGCFVATEYSL